MTMTNEKYLELWRSMPTPDGWTMNDLIVQFGRLVEGALSAPAELPPLPKPLWADMDGKPIGYTAEQMREYARAAQPAVPYAPTDEQITEIIRSSGYVTWRQAREIAALLAQRAAHTAQGSGKDAELTRLREIARLIGSIFVYGGFEAETYNERELERLLRAQGTFWESIHDYENVAAAPQDAQEAGLQALVDEAQAMNLYGDLK